uniref:Uncharacterized protein n=1 Tax=Salix viminalis TaxID=40686 RepID=A0A6N2KZB3_SALVM
MVKKTGILCGHILYLFTVHVSLCRLSSPVLKSRILGSCRLQSSVDSWGMKMEGLLCSNTVVLESFLSSVMETVVLETAIATSKALALSLFMIGFLPTRSSVFPEESGTSQGFPLTELHTSKKPNPDNQDGSDTEDDDEDGDEDGQDDHDDDEEVRMVAIQRMSLNANGDDGSGDDEDNEEEGDDEEDEDDEDDEDDEEDEDDDDDDEDDDDEDIPQPPAKRRK